MSKLKNHLAPNKFLQAYRETFQRFGTIEDIKLCGQDVHIKFNDPEVVDKILEENEIQITFFDRESIMGGHMVSVKKADIDNRCQFFTDSQIEQGRRGSEHGSPGRRYESIHMSSGEQECTNKRGPIVIGSMGECSSQMGSPREYFHSGIQIKSTQESVAVDRRGHRREIEPKNHATLNEPMSKMDSFEKYLGTGARPKVPRICTLREGRGSRRDRGHIDPGKPNMPEHVNEWNTQNQWAKGQPWHMGTNREVTQGSPNNPIAAPSNRGRRTFTAMKTKKHPGNQNMPESGNEWNTQKQWANGQPGLMGTNREATQGSPKNPIAAPVNRGRRIFTARKNIPNTNDPNHVNKINLRPQWHRS